MKRTILTLLALNFLTLFAQNTDNVQLSNTAGKLLEEKPGITIGGYGEIHYNQPLNKDTYEPGTLDAHRLVMFLGYNFSSKTQFVSEIEFEYARELWVEQMFLQHKINKYMNLRAGLLLIPMGIINEYHEPTLFNGVERPMIDNKIEPSTWREIGFGLSGNILQLKSRYQLYLVNGFNGYDGTNGLFSGSKALREGRQKGSKAYITSPALTGKIEFYGAKNLNVGISGYFGKSQSKLFLKLRKDDPTLIQRADSSVVGISMVGADVRYNRKGLRITGQLYYLSISNTEEYNVFTAVNSKNNDLGNAMIGYYAEIGYNILKPFEKVKSELMPFVRYEAFDTHLSVDDPVQKNDAYNNNVITTGLTYTITKGVVLKTDIQFMKNKSEVEYNKVFNAGFGIVF